MKQTIYKCPYCNFEILEPQWLLSKHDFDCPECGNYKLLDFKKETINIDLDISYVRRKSCHTC